MQVFIIIIIIISLPLLNIGTLYCIFVLSYSLQFNNEIVYQVADV